MNRNQRQILAFGEKGQKDIEAQHVAIVGLGGLGSHVAQGLAYLGVKHFVLIDDDKLSVTNLNRTPGAYPDDVGVLKVELAKRSIEQINAETEVAIFPKNLRTTEAFEALQHATTIFGCLDHDAPRLVLMELAAAYEINSIDSASEIFPATEKEPFDFGGRVIVSRPGDFCLSCANQIDMGIAKQELEDEATQAVRRAHGYGMENRGEAASVYSLNGIIANLAMTEFMVMTTGIRPPERKLTFKGMRGVVTVSTDKQRPDCFTCSYLRGKGSRVNLERYLLAPSS